MATTMALVQAEVDLAVKEKAAAVLEDMGMTVSDAVRMLLTRTAEDGALPFSVDVADAAYDPWFRAKVQEALDDPRPRVANDKVKAYFAARRAGAEKSGIAG